MVRMHVYLEPLQPSVGRAEFILDGHIFEEQKNLYIDYNYEYIHHYSLKLFSFLCIVFFIMYVKSHCMHLLANGYLYRL